MKISSIAFVPGLGAKQLETFQGRAFLLQICLLSVYKFWKVLISTELKCHHYFKKQPLQNLQASRVWWPEFMNNKASFNFISGETFSHI